MLLPFFYDYAFFMVFLFGGRRGRLPPPLRLTKLCIIHGRVDAFALFLCGGCAGGVLTYGIIGAIATYSLNHIY